VQCVLDRFAQNILAQGTAWHGFDLVAAPPTGPNGIAWEFTGQVVVAARIADALYDDSRFETVPIAILADLQNAQAQAPFRDMRGLVAATVAGGDTLDPREQCLSTPFQCIPERWVSRQRSGVSLRQRTVNPLTPFAGCENAVTFAAANCRLDVLVGTLGAAIPPARCSERSSPRSNT